MREALRRLLLTFPFTAGRRCENGEVLSSPFPLRPCADQLASLTTLPFSATPDIRAPLPHMYSVSLLRSMFL